MTLDPDAVRKLLDAQFGKWKPKKQPLFRLLIHDEGGASEGPISRFGGVPLAPKGMDWPTCRKCSSPLQFVAQLRLKDAENKKLPDGLLLLFVCAFIERDCQTYDPKGGSNHALVVPLEDLAPLSPPEDAPRVTQPVHDLDKDKVFGPIPLKVLSVRPSPPKSYEDSLGDDWESQYARAVEETGEDKVLAELLKRPSWQQDEEPQKCPSCKKRMRYVGQFGHLGWSLDWAVHLGDAGTGYAFACSNCFGQARFLWQSG